MPLYRVMLYHCAHADKFCRQTQKNALKPSDFKGMLYNYLMLLYGAGLRTGEMLGLTWDHVDLKYGCIHIVRQLVHRKGGRYGFTPLRSASLVCDVVIDGRLKSQLSRWRSDQKMRGLLDAAFHAL